MSSGQWTRHDGFNQTQIKDGWIVKLNKDGSIRHTIGPWKPNPPKKA
jgi:hypothetical protein